jgi:di/tricarboxylate transporter
LPVNRGEEREPMTSRLSRLALTALGALSFVPAARAQGCILRSIAMGVGMPTVVHALQVGVLSMLIPVVLLFLGILLLILRRARRDSVSS